MPGWNPRPNSAWSGGGSPRSRLLQAAGGPTGVRSPHILASPPGTAAPLDAINYTPKTNQIHPRGQLAPVDELNYSLLPSGGMGMGAGAAGLPAPPVMPGQERLTGRYSAPASMATGMYQPGTPPMRPSPYSTGPGPRSAPSGPSPAAFDNRSSMRGMARGWGAGAGQASDLSDLQLQALQKLRNGEDLTAEEQAAIDDLEGGLTDPGSATQTQTQTTTQAPAAQDQGGQATTGGATASDETQALTLAPTATGQPGENAPVGWHTEGGKDDRPGHPTQLWWVSNDGKKRLFMGTYQPTMPGQPDRFIHAQAADQQQLSTGIDFTKAKAPPNLVRQTIRNPKTNQNEIFLIDPKTGKKINPQTGQPDDNAPSIGLSSSQPKDTAAAKPTPQKVQVIPGVGVLVEDPKTGHMVLDQEKTDAYNKAQAAKTSSSTATEELRAQAQLATDKPYTTFVAKDGATWLFDSETGDSYPITPADPLNGIFTVGNQLVKVDPDTGTANVTYTAPHNWSITTSGGRTIAYDPQDPSNHQDLAVDETAQQTAAVGLDQAKANLAKTQQDLITGKISAEEARAKLAIQAHDLLHPQSYIVGGNLITPAGAEEDINYASIPGMPQRPSKHVSGGPLDAESMAAAKHINDFLAKLDASDTGTAAATQTKQGAAQQDTGASQAQQNLAAQVESGKPLLAPGMAGTAKGDPSLASTGVPDTTYTNPRQHFTPPGGSDYSYNASPWDYGDPQATPQRLASQGGGDWNTGSSLDVGVTTDEEGGGEDSEYDFAAQSINDPSRGMGGGQDTFMGRGLTPATGRGSTGIGWKPRRGWQLPGAGHTSAGGRGGGGAAGGGGAGQDDFDPSTGDIGTLPLGASPVDKPGWLDKLRNWVDPAQHQLNLSPPKSIPDAAYRAAQDVQKRQYPMAGPGGLGLWDPRIGSPPNLAEDAHEAFAVVDPGNVATTAMGNTQAREQVGQVAGAGQAAGPPPPPPPPGAQQMQQPAGQNDPQASALIQWLTQLNQKLAAMGQRLGVDPSKLGQGAPQGPAGGAGQDETMPQAAAGGPPAAPSPAAPPSPQAGWTPPVPPQAVAGIGHRFGQSMDVGEPQHSGVDLQAPEGTPTVSPVNGLVERVEHNPEGLGLTVIIRGKDGSEHRLGHLSRTDAYPGMQVVQGQDLQSKVGSTGNTTGAHLHWGVRDGQGNPQDPTASLGPMGNLPPVPGTEQMGPPGGTPGPGGPPPGGPPAPPPTQGAGQDSGSPDYQAGYQAGLQASKSPGTPPVFVPAMQQPIPLASDSSSGGNGQQQGQGAGQDDNPLSMPWSPHNAWELWGPHSQDDPLLRAGGSSSASPAVTGGVHGLNPMAGLQRMGQVQIDPGEAFGTGQESMDSRWDLYEAKDTSGFWGPPGQPDLGSGGEGGMGAGGVYVKHPDGSMHWDETAIDPNPNGGSVVQAGTEHNAGGGTVIQGANRQSGPTGPGGTGPPGSQARAAHVAELQANPSFASGTSGQLGLWSGVSPDLQPYGTDYGTPTGSAGSALSSGLSSQIDPLSTIQQQVDPFGWNKDVLSARFDPTKTAFDPSKGLFDKSGKPTTSIGSTLNVGLTPSKPPGAGGEGGMGAGAVSVTPDTQATIDAQVRVAQMQVDEQNRAADLQHQAAMAQVNANIAAENDRHAEAVAKMQQDYAFHADDVALKQQEDQENQRHNQAMEVLQQQSTQMQQTLEQMREANAVQLQQMQEGTQVYLQQGDQAFKDWQTTQADRMQILSSALSNPWLQQLAGMAPAPGAQGAAVGGQNISNLINQILQPYNAQAYGMQNAPSAMNAPSTAGGVAPGATGSQPTAAQMGMAQGPGAQGGTPTWSQWQGWNPFQMAAYRTNIEAMGPGAWNQAQQGLASQFAAQGGSPNITQMQAAAATPEQSAGQQMTANVFGQTGPEWQQQQQKQWSQAQAPQVKSNLTGIAA